jgi:ribosomal protein L32E
MAKFLRRTWYKFSKLGRGRKKKQVWRKPTGRDNKLREKRKNRGAVVSVGYKKPVQKKIFAVRNISDLQKLRENNIAVIGNVGRKKKIEIVKKAKEKNIHFQNLNSDEFLRSVEKKTEENRTKEKGK